MNGFAIVILLALVAEYVLGIIADRLNLRALREEVPLEFEGVYEAEAYRTAQAYTRVRTRFGWIASTFGLVLLLGFWFLGGFNLLDVWIRGWGWGPIGTGLLYIAALTLGHGLLTLPLSLYSTFVIEERFGFNQTTWKTFLMDRLKGLVLGVLIGVPLLAGILWFFNFAGSLAWLYCWITVTVFTLIMQFVAPTWIMPLFNKFTPLEDGELREAIFAYAQSVRFPLQNLFVIDGSKRSTKSNAFFTGFGKNKRIALYDTLIEKHTVPELVAVIAHEVGHYKRKHILQGMIVGIVHTGVLFLLLSVVLGSAGLYKAFYMAQPSVYAGLLFFGLLYTPIEFFLSMAMQWVSRKHEYEADAYAADTTGQAQPLVDALKKLSVHNLSNLTPHPFYVFLHYSHPPVLARINTLRKYTPAEQP